MIEEMILEKVVSVAIDRAGNYLTEMSFNLDTGNDEIEDNLSSHLRQVKNWAEEVSFKDSFQAKSINDIYVNLDLSLIPRRRQLEDQKHIQTIKFDALSLDKHIVILGQPGAGKTTSLKYLTYKMLFEEKTPFNLVGYNYPILIKFRELDNIEEEHFLLEKLIKIYGINIKHNDLDKYEIPKEKFKKMYKELSHSYIQKFIDSQRIILILDGFDELPNIEAKENAVKSIRLLSSSLDNSLIILTSRSSDYDYHINGTEEFEIAPLDEKQIKLFSEKWLGKKRLSDDFLEKVKASPFYDTTIRPLTIAHLCAIYARKGDIPKKPKTVYKKLINLLLEEWDFQRSVKRDSQYANFEIDRKFEFLSALSFDLTTYFNLSVFNTYELERAYNRIHVDFGLPQHESRKVVKEIESHSGLLIKSGYDQFMFAHKSLQEYFTANYLVKLPEFPRDTKIVKVLPNEFAIAISISSNSSEYFKKFVADFVINSDVSESFLATFINRLVLEKPDFSHTPAVIFTFLKLYEIYYKKLSQQVGDNNNSSFMDYITPIDTEPLGQILISLGELIIELVSRGEEFRNILSKKYKIQKSTKYYFIYRKIYQCDWPKKVYLPNKER